MRDYQNVSQGIWKSDFAKFHREQKKKKRDPNAAPIGEHQRDKVAFLVGGKKLEKIAHVVGQCGKAA